MIQIFHNGMHEIRFMVMDVDGTLTDGKIYMGNNGEVMKAFDAKDGYAIKCILPKLGVIPVVITARESMILQNRCCELGIEELYQGKMDKLAVIYELLEGWTKRDGVEYSLSNVAYIGDDMLDLACMKPIVESNGITGCPNNAIADVKAFASYICSNNGGDGAVREFIEWISGSEQPSH